jgi:hypothetical protein
MLQECERVMGGGAQTNLFGSPDWIKAIVLVDLGLQFLYPRLPHRKYCNTFINSFGRQTREIRDMPLLFLVRFLTCTSTALQRILNLFIHRKGIARAQSQFPHSCACEQSIYSHVQSTYLSAAE